MVNLSIVAALVLAQIGASVAFFDSKVSIQRDGTTVDNGWDIQCAELGGQSTATFTVQVDTTAGFSTYNVEITSQWTSATVAASAEEGVFQVGVGKGKTFRSLAVGEEHKLSVSNVYEQAGDHQTEFVAKISTGNWDWPDGHEFASGDNVLSVSRGSCSYNGVSGKSSLGGTVGQDSKAENSRAAVNSFTLLGFVSVSALMVILM